MQRIFNYGSFLQAYGLREILKELHCNVEFVDYHPGKCLVPPTGGKGIFRKVAKGMEVFRYQAPLLEKIRYIKYKKNYASNYYPYLGIDENYNYAPELDVLVIGSDEVFNCVQNNTNVGYTPELFGVGNHAKKVISYAASCGNTTFDKLEEYGIEKEVAGWLEEFDAFSVRDENTGAVVKMLTGRTPQYHLDPVLIYDYFGKCKEIPSAVPDSGYMILYGYSGRFRKEECAAIRTYARRRGLQVFCIGGVQDCCDKFIDCSPFEVLAYFKHAEAIVTDTFHGTIMSVITHQKFASFVRSKGYSNSEKLIDLLERLQLSDHIIRDMKELDEVLEKSVSYAKVDCKIEEERRNAYHYLREQLK